MAMISPPPSPPSGPRSMTQSAVLMTSRLCSMTTMVLPSSRRRCSTSSSCATSWKCRPVVGSSRMYSVRPVDALGQLARELHALSFSAGEGRRVLPQAHVGQADVGERLQLAWRSPARSGRTAARPRPSCRVPRTRSCRDSGSPASRGCSAGPCRHRTARTRPEENAFPPSARHRPDRPRSVRLSR